MPWNDEMVESLKKMWDEGLSTGEIGRRLGVSKNSIVGKVHRLQLVARPSPIKKKDGSSPDPKAKTENKNKTKTAKPEKTNVSDSPQKTEKAKAPVIKTKNESEKVQTAPQPVQPDKVPVKEKEHDTFVNISIPVTHTPKKPGEKITVTDLDNHTCRWPIGDPKDENFRFCGANVRIGQTYCEEHAAIAYVKNIKK